MFEKIVSQLKASVFLIQDRGSEIIKRLKPAESFYKRESRSQTRTSSESDVSEGIEVVPGNYGTKFISSKSASSDRLMERDMAFFFRNSSFYIIRIKVHLRILLTHCFYSLKLKFSKIPWMIVIILMEKSYSSSNYSLHCLSLHWPGLSGNAKKVIAVLEIIEIVHKLLRNGKLGIYESLTLRQCSSNAADARTELSRSKALNCQRKMV